MARQGGAAVHAGSIGGLGRGAVLLHIAFALTGLGTAMLGPILPLLARHWQLRDEQSGLLLMAQFCGSFLGGVTVNWRLRRSLLIGMAASAAGLAGFSASLGLGSAPGLWAACTSLLLGGFGLGHSITAINIMAGQRFKTRRASALALLNFFWSFGAMMAPLLTAALAPRFSLRALLASFAILLAACGFGLAVRLHNPAVETTEGTEHAAEAVGFGLPAKVLLFFMAALFLYGGVETCLSGWLTTYALRYGDRRLVISEYTTLLLWMSLTAGRAISSAVLLRAPERLVRRVALIATVVLTAAMAFAHSASAIALCTVLLGLSLAPWFPVTFSLLMGQAPRARQAGTVIAVSGLGAAALPWLMGVVSTRAGSLQTALAIPLLAGFALVIMSFVRIGKDPPSGSPHLG